MRKLAAAMVRCGCALLATLWLCANASAALPRPIARAFLDQRIPLAGVSVYVQELGAPRPLVSHQPSKPMNPASTMKLLTTFAGLELLGPEYRWKTEAYADGALDGGVLHGNLILKGYGDPKITIEQIDALVAQLRAAGLETIGGDLVLDHTFFASQAHDAAAFDGEPFKPYNVGPDALLVNFKSVRFVFAPNADTNAVDLRIEPNLASIAVHRMPQLVPGECGDWRGALQATFSNRRDRADVAFPGHYAIGCGEHDWYVALLDHSHYAGDIFVRAWASAGGRFEGGVRDGHAPLGATPIATLLSPPLYDIVRDINKLSNNVMARQLFLTLATSAHPPPATTAYATEAVKRWLAKRKLVMPELALDNGSGLSRRERIAARSMARLLVAAQASSVGAELVSSLAVAATDGTVRKRFNDGVVADQAFLKTGTLEGVRAIAGYVYGQNGRRFVVVCLVNHRNALHAQPALDLLVQWVYDSSIAQQLNP